MVSGTQLKVGVAIVAFGNPQDVRQCLESLSLSEHTAFEVVICENGGAGAYADLVAAIPARLPGGQPVRTILAPGNLGYAGGVNRCLEDLPDAEACWVLNPDTAPEPGALAALVARLTKGDCDAVGSTVHLPDGTVQSHGGHWRPALARAVSIGHGEAMSVAVDAAALEARQNYLNGASMLVSRRFIEVAGLMREDYFLYCEEVEWCLRAIARDLRLGFAPGAPILHEQGASTGNKSDLKLRSRLSVYLNERNRLLLTRDCYPRLLPVATVAALLLLALRFGRGGAWRQLGFALEGWWAGLRDERGVPASLPAPAAPRGHVARDAAA